MATEEKLEGRIGCSRGNSRNSGVCPSCPPAAVQGYREEAASLQTQIDALPTTHVPLTLPFRCQSTASPRFNILTLRAAEN